MQELRRTHSKKTKKSTVQLTSLLDLLFVMIFVSLMQEKITPEMAKKLKEQTAKKSKITKVKVEEKKKTPPKKITPVLKTYTVEAIFYFQPANNNPNAASGRYKMLGSFNEKNRSLKLSGLEWIERPPQYDMVPLSGTIEKGDSLFTGRVDFPGCKVFKLNKIQSIPNNPISGIWEGVYDCAQGNTKLTLTIK
ncbi:MAG: hypothetical protein CME62_07870 [Halobacteriovoraceae bacterium]|nr:hypothetical protein [Halobacteriovoraceae bacterium]|tara:strand:- start:3796 stop:4374 length:579 start_codon:yes stop_codon:yes gene_type:complete